MVSAPRETTRARFQEVKRHIETLGRSLDATCRVCASIAPEPLATIPANRQLPFFNSKYAVLVRITSKHDLNAVACRRVALNRQRPFVVRRRSSGEHYIRPNLGKRVSAVAAQPPAAQQCWRVREEQRPVAPASHKPFDYFSSIIYPFYMFLGRRSLGEGGYTAKTFSAFSTCPCR